MREIPFTGSPRERIVFDMEGRAIEVLAQYSDVSGAWSVSLTDVESGPLVSGVRVVLGLDLLAPYALRVGGLVAFATSDPRRDPGKGELGSRVRLVHVAESEL